MNEHPRIRLSKRIELEKLFKRGIEMNEQDVWPLATELWEKRKKINLLEIEVCKYYSMSGYYIETSGNKIEDQHTFHTKAEVRQFLDGLG